MAKNSLCSVSFYAVGNDSIARVAALLCDKAYHSGHRVLLHVEQKDAMEAFDYQLWTFKQKSFLPHGTTADLVPEWMPILISQEGVNRNNAAIYMGCAHCIPENVDEFARVIDIFNQSDNVALKAARARWRTYAGQGKEVSFWTQDQKTRKWQKAHEVAAVS